MSTKLKELQDVLNARADEKCHTEVERIFTAFTGSIPSQILYALSFGPPPGAPGPARMNGYAVLSHIKGLVFESLQQRFRTTETETFLTDLEDTKKQIAVLGDKVDTMDVIIGNRP